MNKISCIPETIETIEVYDSRLDEKEIIKPQSAKASYDYYKTYRTGVSGAYGATGYSKPSVTVSSWSANKMKFKVHETYSWGTYTMTGTKTISLP